ncbi:MAG: GGDEF domain-containing protein [Huintestinicola sp.]
MEKNTVVNYTADEKTANTYVFRCMVFTCALFAFIWVLNKLNIFTVDTGIMNSGMVGVLIPFVICCILVKFVLDMNSPSTKYIILGFFSLIIAILNITVTYHAVLTTALPFICAVHYAEKKVVWYTYFLTAASIVCSVIFGFMYGLCDANMLLLTNTYTSVHMQQLAEGNIVLNDNIGLIILWWAFPRCLVCVAYIPIMFHISNYIRVRAENEFIARKNAEIDGMTGLFNKRKYMSMTDDSYHNCKKVGVIFWDANNLKKINDKIGHEQGDQLIKTVSDSIKMFTSEKCSAYRTGGDEFVMICSEPRNGQIEKIVSDWHKVIDSTPDICGIAVTAAVG